MVLVDNRVFDTCDEIRAKALNFLQGESSGQKVPSAYNNAT